MKVIAAILVFSLTACANVTSSDTQAKKEVPEPDDSRSVQEVLSDLTALALRIENESIDLQTLRKTESQPDAAMWKLRILAHENPEALKLIEAYIRSDAPVASRVLALLALISPQNRGTIELVASIMRDPPSSTLANASCLCVYESAANGIGEAWNSVFRCYLGMLKFPKGYRTCEYDQFIYEPKSAGHHAPLYKSNSWSLELAPIVASLIPMLEHSDEEINRNMWLDMAFKLMSHPISTPKDRERLSALAEKWYLEFDPGPGWSSKGNCYYCGNGWFGAMEALTKSHSPRVLEIIGAGLVRLTPEWKTYVLEEVSHRAKFKLMEPPLRAHLEDAIAVLSVTPEKGGHQRGTFSGILASIVFYGPDEQWSREYLASHAPEFRRRVAESLAGWACGGDFLEEGGRRYLAIARYLIADADFNTRFAAALTLQGLIGKKTLIKKTAVLTMSETHDARATLDGWIAAESARDLTPAETDKLNRIKSALLR